MGKNRDLIIILLIVIIGMFIPFLGSISIMFNITLTRPDSWWTIGKTFGWFLLIFGFELGAVYLYFTITNSVAQKKIDKQNFQENK